MGLRPAGLAHVAQVAEHFLGKEKVPGSNPGVGSTTSPTGIAVEPALPALREVATSATSRFADSVREDPVLDASKLRESAGRA